MCVRERGRKEGRKEGRKVRGREREGGCGSVKRGLGYTCVCVCVCVDGKCRLRRRAWFRALDGVCACA